jgi:hypothetical protein
MAVQTDEKGNLRPTREAVQTARAAYDAAKATFAAADAARTVAANAVQSTFTAWSLTHAAAGGPNQ